METSNSLVKIVSFVLVVVVVSVLVWFFLSFNKSEDKTLTPEQKGAILQELANTTKPITEEAKEGLLENLSKTTRPITEEEKQSLLENLSKTNTQSSVTPE